MAMLGGDLAGPGEVLPRRRLAAKEVLGGRRGEVLGADGRQSDSRVGDGAAVAVQPDRRPGRGDRPVADPASHLLIGASAAGDDRDPELGKDLAGADDRLVLPGVAVPGLYRPGPFPTLDHHPRP